MDSQSSILANIYLHYVLDIWFEKKVEPNCKEEAYLCRYADDFICAFRFRGDVLVYFYGSEYFYYRFFYDSSNERKKI